MRSSNEGSPEFEHKITTFETPSIVNGVLQEMTYPNAIRPDDEPVTGIVLDRTEEFIGGFVVNMASVQTKSRRKQTLTPLNWRMGLLLDFMDRNSRSHQDNVSFLVFARYLSGMNDAQIQFFMGNNADISPREYRKKYYLPVISSVSQALSTGRNGKIIRLGEIADKRDRETEDMRELVNKVNFENWVIDD